MSRFFFSLLLFLPALALWSPSDTDRPATAAQAMACCPSMQPQTAVSTHCDRMSDQSKLTEITSCCCSAGSMPTAPAPEPARAPTTSTSAKPAPERWFSLSPSADDARWASSLPELTHWGTPTTRRALLGVWRI